VKQMRHLIIDPDRVLAATIAVKRFQPIGRRRPQSAKRTRMMKHIHLSQAGFSIRRSRFTNSPIHILSVALSRKRLDHGIMYSTSSNTSKRIRLPVRAQSAPGKAIGGD